jgi:hypothetical protein
MLAAAAAATAHLKSDFKPGSGLSALVFQQ